MARRREWWGLAFVAPIVLFFTVFFLYPLGRTAYLSLTDYDLLSPPRFAGLDNYGDLLHDPVFHRSLLTTGFYVAASAIPVCVFALALALVLQRPGRIHGLVAAAFFLPVVISDVVVAVVWKLMLGQFGPVNSGLAAIGATPAGFTSDPGLVPWSLVAITVWQWTGWTMVIFLAGLRTIPRNLYDAARVDGASSRQMFRDITLPLLRPTVFFVIAISVITGAQSFGYQYVIGNGSGGPGGATNVVALHIYRTAFTNLDVGHAAAMSMVLLVLLLAVIALQLRVYPSELRRT
ncbi:MAG: sugar ABC transporter permease [Chloroflexota bacterium]|nr:sugar ABC transporter permease [Chloroflexota bacterium]